MGRTRASSAAPVAKCVQYRSPVYRYDCYAVVIRRQIDSQEIAT